MCDYSLLHVESTAARVGDRLVSTRFANAITRGFAAEGRPDVAVCLLPGTELAFDRQVECDCGPYGRAIEPKATVARFRQINPDQPYAHHDALEFPDGELVLITHLAEGQRAVVLQLPAGAVSGEHGHGHAHPTTGQGEAASRRLPVTA